MRRFLDYYRQFEELTPEEISRELLERRDAERANAVVEVPALDLATAAWHEPPDAEAVNAATYALRRSVNAYADPEPLLNALAERYGVQRSHVAAGHGAGELLAGALRAMRIDGPVAIAWPGWGALPRLVHEAGGAPVPVPLGADGAADPEALLAAGSRAVVLCSPNDPTGAAVPAPALLDLAERLDETAWLVVDAALADFAPPDGDDRERSADPLVGDGDDRERGADPPVGDGAPVARLLAARERVVVVRSFSKAHAMAGFRAGAAIGNDEPLLRAIAPVGGVSAPAQAAMLWALASGDPVVARRRALAARERERLAGGLRGTPYTFAAGHGHLVWLRSAEHDGRAVAAHLAARRIYVTPGAAWGDEQHVRLALRGPAATDRLVTALRELPAVD